MSKEYVMQLEATITNLRRDNQLLKERLEAIGQSKPNKAVEYFENMQHRIASNISTIEYTTIKQALIKSQEQEKENAKYKQLEKELGCPLEVVERALMNGIYINGQEGLCIVHRYVKMLTVNQYLSVWIKDYKKTWWLKEDRSE